MDKNLIIIIVLIILIVFSSVQAIQLFNMKAKITEIEATNIVTRTQQASSKPASNSLGMVGGC